MKIHTFTNEIINIAKVNNVAWDVASDMFIANVRNYGKDGMPYYHGADEVDYEDLKKDIKELIASKPSFVLDYSKHSSEIIALRKEGKFDEVKELMEGLD